MQQLKKQFNIGAESPLSFDHFQPAKHTLSTSPTQLLGGGVDPTVYAQQVARAAAAARLSELSTATQSLADPSPPTSQATAGFNVFSQLQANIQRIIARQATLSQLGGLPPMGIESMSSFTSAGQVDTAKAATNEAIVTEIP